MLDLIKKHNIRLAKPGFCLPSLVRTIILIMAVGTIWACAYLKPIDDSSGSQNVTREDPNLTAVYHDFDDILVPKGMRINRKMTRLSKTQAMLAGVISLEGSLDRSEIIRFFKLNMIKDNWAHVDQLIGPRSLLQFEKHNRWCVLTITERPGGYGTQLDIWVVPKNKAT